MRYSKKILPFSEKIFFIGSNLSVKNTKANFEKATMKPQFFRKDGQENPYYNFFSFSIVKLF